MSGIVRGGGPRGPEIRPPASMAIPYVEMESPRVMGPGILPTRDFGDGHAVYEKAAMLGKRRMALQRGAAQEAAAPEGERRPTSCRAPT